MFVWPFRLGAGEYNDMNNLEVSELKQGDLIRKKLSQLEVITIDHIDKCGRVIGNKLVVISEPEEWEKIPQCTGGESK